MFETFEELERFLKRYRKENKFDFEGFFEIKVIDPYIFDEDLPDCNIFCRINAYYAKELMSKYAEMRWLIISPDAEEIYGEAIYANYIIESSNDKNTRDTLKCFFDYGILYGNYNIPNHKDVFKTNFTNSFDEWSIQLRGYEDYFPDLDEGIYVQINYDYSWLKNLSHETLDFYNNAEMIGLGCDLITKDFSSKYCDEYRHISGCIPIAALRKDDICKKYNGKEFDTFYGAWEKEEE